MTYGNPGVAPYVNEILMYVALDGMENSSVVTAPGVDRYVLFAS